MLACKFYCRGEILYRYCNGSWLRDLRRWPQTLRRLAGERVAVPERDSLRSLAIAGMSRPLALLKTASVIHVWAHERHEGLSAIITLADRLVTSALALETLPDLPQESRLHERLLNVADGCERMRRAFNELRLPDDWVALADEKNAPPPFPLLDIKTTLDQIALAVPRFYQGLGASSDATPAEKRSLFLPMAPSTIPSMSALRSKARWQLSFATWSSSASIIRVSTRQSSRASWWDVNDRCQQPERDPAFWRLRGRWTDGSHRSRLPVSERRDDRRVLAGLRCRDRHRRLGELRHSPYLLRRLSVGLAFYKAILQDFGPAASATVVRDRLIGVFFGLLVYGAVEHLLWPVRAQDALRARLAEMMRLLAELLDRKPELMRTRRCLSTTWIPGAAGFPRKLRRRRG